MRYRGRLITAEPLERPSQCFSMTQKGVEQWGKEILIGKSPLAYVVIEEEQWVQLATIFPERPPEIPKKP